MKTLVLIDVQNDFMPRGPLEVPEGNLIIPVINSCLGYFDLVVATQDWHPKNHKSFAAIFRKGMDIEVDSYSGFYDNNHRLSTGLSGYLKEKGVSEIYFCGLAADICVYYSILDAVREGFSATLIEDASRPLYPEKFDDIKCEIAKQSVHIITSSELLDR